MPVFGVGPLDDLADGRGRVVFAGGRELAVFRVGERVHVLDNECVHTGGPLGEGEVVDGCVECPWHGWRYDVETGHSPINPRVRVGVYRAWVEDGEVKVELPGGMGD